MWLLSVALLSGFVSPPTDRVPGLVAQLGSPDFHARESATRALEAVGPPALAALRAAAASQDMEVARRAGDLVARITRRADNDRTLAPVRVELAFEDRPLSEVLAALGKQSGYKVMAPDLDDPTVKVTVKTNGKVPFWVAVQAVCDAAGLEVASATPTAAPATTTFEYSTAPVRPLVLPLPAARGVLPGPPPAPRVAPPPGGPVPPNVGAAALRRNAEVARDLADVLKRRLEAVERVQKDGNADKRKLEDLRAAQHAEAQKLLQLLVQEQTRQAVAFRDAPPPAAAALPGTVLLRPRSKPRPACVSGAVRVEAGPFPANSIGSVPPDQIPLVLTATAEPRLKWEHVEAVRVTKAVDDAGRNLVAAPAGDPAEQVQRVQPIQGGAIVLGGDGRPFLLPASAATSLLFHPQPTQAVVRLKAGDGPTKVLKELEGVVRAVVRTGPEEMAAVGGFDAGPVSAFGPNGLGLKVSKMEPVPDTDEFSIDVVVGYKAAEVQLADNSAPALTETVGNGQVIVRQQMVIGGEVVVRQRVIGAGFGGGRRGGYRVAGDNSGLSVFGLTVTDAAGTPFELTAPTSVRRFDAEGGVTDEVKLVLKPTAKGQGKPAKVAFAGVRSKTIEVPFKLADVPVAAGTGPAGEKK